MAAAKVQPGDLVAQKYRVERVIGQGGMGIVVAALDVTRNTRVALKFLLPHTVDSAEKVARFEREARASLALESEHVCRALDVGRREDGTPYIAMELLEGMDLAHELHRRGGHLPIVEAVSYIAQACDAIAEAHAHGIIHRDLKPANLFLANRTNLDPIVKVLDFGISKPTAASQSPSALTGTADLLGSPLYMSPEQLRAPKSVDARADVWSLGATLYELVTGKPPFDGSTLADLSTAIFSAPAPDVRERVPNAPPAFAEAIKRALAKNRDERFPGVDELTRALAPFGSARGRTMPLAAIAAIAARKPNRTVAMPIQPAPAPALPPSAPMLAAPTPRAVAPPARPSDAAGVDPPSPPPTHARRAPIAAIAGVAIAGAVVAALITIAVAGSKDELKPEAPVASASAGAAGPASAPPSARVAASAAIPPGELAVRADASSEPASAPPPPRPTSVPSAQPDARVFESAGY